MRIARIICIVSLAIGCSLTIPAQSRAQIAVGVSVRIGPPPLPVYVQPVCPGPDYIWVPGYWAYDYEDEDYFWVPGTWVLGPEPGFLWTPGYWGWSDGFYAWHAGYWGPVVGFYGGIDYGFGYPGDGFYGGYWRGGSYYYNRSVTNVNVNVVHNIYNTTVVNNNTTVNRVSFNGGPGGVSAQPTREEVRAERERHVSMTAEQTQHIQIARNERTLRASVNHGRPDIAASPRAGEFHGRGPVENGRVEHANRPPDNRAENRNESNRPGRLSDNGRSFPDRPGTDNGGRGSSDRPPFARSSSNTGLDQKHQRESDKMQRQQDFERQKMQQRHDQEQQRLSRQNANQQRQDQLQRRQQQQLEQMNRKHNEQSQKLQERQQREDQRQENRKPNSNRPDNRNEPNRSGRLSDNGRSFPDRPGTDDSGRRFSDRPRSAQSSSGASWNPALEQKHQQDFDRMHQQQEAERQRMQQRHDQEQQRMSRQNADQHRQDQLQYRQQQQIEQMNRKHDQQSQRLEERQQRETQKQDNRKPSNNRPDRQQR